MKIYKYPILKMGYSTIEVPYGAKFLSAGLDLNQHLSVWMLVDPDQKIPDIFECEVVYTGEAPQRCRTFVATITANLVYHVFTT